MSTLAAVERRTDAHAEPAAGYGGTYRQACPQRTWARLEPLLAAAGITRVADVTRLDDIGIPVWQAVRPNSANITVSQGKGVTHLLAKVSAAMEAFELHCAEECRLPRRRSTAAGLGRRMESLLDGLPLLPHHVFDSRTVLDWHPVEELSTGGRYWWPCDAISVDFRVRTRWVPPVIRVNSNGLASGNTLAEASLHGLLELVERHSLARARGIRMSWSPAARVSGGTGVAGQVAERIAAAGGVLDVMDITAPELGVPTFLARVWSASLPHWFSGSGSHLDPAVALSRSLTEAVQSRVTAIAGARDDIAPVRYDFTADTPTAAGRTACSTDELIDRSSGPGAPSGTRDLERDLAEVVDRCARNGWYVLRADLTRDNYGIPVVRMASPGLVFAERHGHG